MDPFSFVLEYWPALLAGLAFVVAVVVALNVHGRKLDRHQEYIRRLQLSTGNLHKARERANVRVMQRPTWGEPPPLSDARTTEVTDEMLATLRLDSKKEDQGGEG